MPPGREVPIRLAEGAERVGLAVMIADLIRQTVEQNPRKRAVFDRLRTSVFIDAHDAEVSVTLVFEGGGLVVHGGNYGAPRIRIRTDADSVLALCMVKMMGGVPHPLHHHNRELLRRILNGEIRIEGISGSVLQLLRFTRLVSVRD